MRTDGTVIDVDVECYSGTRNAERPRVVVLGPNRLAVVEILYQWRNPTGPCFDVMLEDGQQARLCLNESEDRWSMEAS
jgi:hypothetical protein